VGYSREVYTPERVIPVRFIPEVGKPLLFLDKPGTERRSAQGGINPEGENKVDKCGKTLSTPQ